MDEGNTVRAVRNSDQGILVAEVDEPEGPGVRLAVASAGLCGTDVNFAAGGVQGYTYGHEFAGTTTDGRSYAVEPTVYCGECDQCRAGHVQRCSAPEHGTLGMFRDGGICDAVTVSENMLVQLPPGLDVRDACLVEPTSVAVHGVRSASLEKGERVAIVGGGSIGLLAAARQRGFDVDVEVRHEHQRIAAERLEAGSAAGAYDVVIDAAGSEAGLARCAELARPGGRVVLLGVDQHIVPIPGRCQPGQGTHRRPLRRLPQARRRPRHRTGRSTARRQPRDRAGGDHPPAPPRRRRGGLPGGG
ncbi:alcohol dehydrogenase catalytic domain-containing protein [Amycolatopsis ultiminotia]|uniref:alcohol dehydrogenase catalytic domain-containing protein n=1 Tax=Amycolatopsis ultiminotia TaxID=543629 RepID=UPI0031EF8D90